MCRQDKDQLLSFPKKGLEKTKGKLYAACNVMIWAGISLEERADVVAVCGRSMNSGLFFLEDHVSIFVLFILMDFVLTDKNTHSPKAWEVDKYLNEIEIKRIV